MLASLRQMTLGGVKKIAEQKGVDKEALEDCDDNDDPKEAVIQQILVKNATPVADPMMLASLRHPRRREEDRRTKRSR